MESKFQELKERLREINDLESASALLHWDQATYMPPEGAPARARQLATLRRLAHKKFTDPAIGKLLEDLRSYEESLPYDSEEASLIRVTRRDYERAVKIPPSFMAELHNHTAETYQVWTQARPENNFPKVRPYLEKTLDLSRQLADFFPGYEHIADPLIDFSDYGMKVSVLRPLFTQLREKLVPFVQTITSLEPPDDTCLREYFPESRQIAFATEVIQRFGYDFRRGRLDKTHHPFMTQFSLRDVRITYRVKERDLREGLFSIFHETGHALYGQGIKEELEGTPLAEGASAGVHESQSRLWENLVGRSRSFWLYFYPRLQEVFPESLGSVSMETFYRAINKVERSLIRTDADEVTYNLHIILRFDLELQLLEGRLSVKDLPEVWRERYTTDLGVTPPDDRDGVLQDVHWYSGVIGGAFQGYTLGNILSAQFFEAALNTYPGIISEMEKGSFESLHRWLKENIYQHGRKFTPLELVERVTGGPLDISPYLRYLETKYAELYDLSPPSL